VITDANGNVTKRQDYSAFGEETFTAQSVSGLGYTNQDNVRQDYTGYQKDDESGLEFAQARYYNSTHGRFRLLICKNQDLTVQTAIFSHEFSDICTLLLKAIKTVMKGKYFVFITAFGITHRTLNFARGHPNFYS